MIACNKSKESTTTSKKEEKMVVYMASDKSRAKVTFQKENEVETLLIESNNRKFQLDKKSDSSGIKIYERNGIKAEIKGDSLFIIQDSITIPLRKWIID